MGFTAIANFIVPAIISGNLTERHLSEEGIEPYEYMSYLAKASNSTSKLVKRARAKIGHRPSVKQSGDDDDEYTYEEWFEDANFNDLTKAWIQVLEYHSSLWLWFAIMFGLFVW